MIDPYCFSWASNIQKEIRYIEALGTKAGFRIDDTEITLFTRVSGTMFTMKPDPATMPLDTNEFESFTASILQDVPVEADLSQAVKVLELIDKIYASSEFHG